MIPLHDDNPTQIVPMVTIGLIVACVLVFMWQFSLGTEAQQLAVYQFGLIPAVFLNKISLPSDIVAIPSGLTILTSMFMHGGFMHLAGNMLYLWIFGNNVEDAMGHVRFIIFYLLCGAAAVFGHMLQDPSSQIPLVGASGAISGVLGAYILLYPHARVLVLIPLGIFSHLIRLPAIWVLGLWFLMQIVNFAMTDSQGGGVAWLAHIGGYIAGMVLIPFFKGRQHTFFHPAQDAEPFYQRFKRE